jgi:hypothetical protein
MLTVEIDTAAVEERLRSGRLTCPGCAGVLSGWGRARARAVRGGDGSVWISPRRSRCTGCRATHVLLPVLLLVRRADTAAVIGAALAARTAGAGHRRIAALLERQRGRCGAGCGASLGGSRRSEWCSPAGVERWRRILCCPGRRGRSGRMPSPRSPPSPASPVLGSGSARCRSGRSRWPSPRGSSCCRVGPLRSTGLINTSCP